jgi:hypothetical protein
MYGTFTVWCADIPVCFSPSFGEVKLIVVYHPLHVPVMQTGNSFHYIPNVYGKLYCVPGGILPYSMIPLLLHISVLFNNKQTELITDYLCISVVFVVMMMRRRSKLRYRMVYQFWPWIWQEKVSDVCIMNQHDVLFILALLSYHEMC